MKKLLCFVIIICLLISSGSVFASEYDLVKALGIMNGYDNGDFGGMDTLTRSQFAKIVVTMMDKDFAPVGTVSPYGDVPYTHWAAPYIAYASDQGLLSGYPDGTFQPEKDVTYEEAAKVLLCLLKYEVSGSDWASAQISTAKKVGILNGVDPVIGASLTRFSAAKMVENALLTKPKNETKYYIEIAGYRYFQDAVIMTDKTTAQDKVLTSVGTFGKNDMINETDMLKCGDLIIDEYDDIVSFLPKEQTVKSYVVKATLPNGIASFDNDQQIEIADDVKTYLGERQSSYSVMKSEIKTGDRLTLYLDRNNKTEYISIEKDVIEGPITNVGANFASSFGINDNAKIMRDGIQVTAADIKDYDVCYYIRESNTVLAYSKKKTGIYENALPNKDNPTSIQLSGTSYEIGNITAFNKLSSNGSLRFGDTITILFDKDDKIADVLTPSSTTIQTLYLIDTGLKENTDENKDKVYQHYAKLATLDGTELEYVTDKDYNSSRGKLVTVSFADGKAKLSASNSSYAIAGKFDWNNKTLGNNTLASDLKILDVADYSTNHIGKYASVFPQRIDMTEIHQGDVIYVQKNSNGQITSLVLNNVTNDMYSFGLVVKAVKNTVNIKNEYVSAIAMSGEYDLLVGGDQKKINTTDVIYNVYSGQPSLFDFEGDDLKTIKPLMKLSGNITLDQYFVYSDNAKYRISDKVYVYKKTSASNLEYELISLNDVISNQYSVTAYYDNPAQDGGQIRVLMVNN